jgi:hypothetical protein
MKPNPARIIHSFHMKGSHRSTNKKGRQVVIPGGL